MKEKYIITISFAIFFVLLVFALFSNELILSINLFFISIAAMIVPYSIYRFTELRKIMAYEKDLPAFLRDLAESQRAGLSTIDAIHLAAKSEYGVLTKEIRKMSDQLSWNIPLERVLNGFIKNVHKSRIIVRSMMIIEQSNKSGGNVEDTMNSLANSIETIRDVNDEKSNLMNQQVMMIYAIFFIFLGITIVLIKFMMPLLQAQFGGGFGMKTYSANPCYMCTAEAGCISCDILSYVSATFNFGRMEDPNAYYKSLFFMMIVIQAIFSGLIAGQIGSDSVVAGIKHSLIKLISGSLIFMLVVWAGII